MPEKAFSKATDFGLEYRGLITRQDNVSVSPGRCSCTLGRRNMYTLAGTIVSLIGAGRSGDRRAKNESPTVHKELH
jgi:hypothetical protein